MVKKIVFLASFLLIGWLLLYLNLIHKKRDVASAPEYPDYVEVKTGACELAYFIETASTNSPGDFESLRRELNRLFPSVFVSESESNPFPNFLRPHDYVWLKSWTGVTNRLEAPLIWTRVQLDQEVMLYVTLSGEVKVKHTNEFAILLNETLKAGATQKEVNDNHGNQ